MNGSSAPRWLICLLLLVAQRPAWAQLGSPDTLSWSVANDAQCVKAADLDADGDNDVVVGSRLGHHVLLYRNPGNGQFGAPELVMEAEGVFDLELVDLDQDGDLDIVVGDFGNGWVTWCANQGGGAFGPRVLLIDDIFSTAVTALEVGQVDSDTELELFTLNYLGRVGLFQDDGNQQFGTGQTMFIADPPAYGLDIFAYAGTFRFDVVGGGAELWMRSNTGGGFLANPPVLLTSGGDDVRAVAFRPGNSGTLQDVSLYVASEGSGELRIWADFQNGTPSLVNTLQYDGLTDVDFYIIDSLNPNNWWPLVASHSQHGLVQGSVFLTNSVPWGLRSVEAADMDGDGISDLVWCGDEDDDVAWVKRDSLAAGYPERRMTPLSGGTAPPSFADMDGDGDMDAVVPFTKGRSIGWVENLGGGLFAEPAPITISAYEHYKAIPADIDGDGDRDVLTAYGDDTLLYFPNNGLGVFGAPVLISSSIADGSQLAADDVDGDGDVDILTLDHFANGVVDAKALLLNNGNGVFSPSTALAQGPDQFRQLADLDGDGLVDALDESGATGVIWYRNLGGGSFAPNAVIAASGTMGTVRDLCVADVDGDGDDDLLVAAGAGTGVYWLERTGLGWNAPALLFSEPAENIVSVASGDFDGDGDADVLAGLYDQGRVWWYANTGGLIFGPGTQLTDELIIAWHVDVVDLNGDGLEDGIASSSLGDRVLAFLNGSSIMTNVPEGDGHGLDVYFDHASGVLRAIVPGAGPQTRLELYDALGRRAGTLTRQGGEVFRLGVNGLAHGTYVVAFEDGAIRKAVRVAIW